jgi:putative SOS response-associated peptidase YedK
VCNLYTVEKSVDAVRRIFAELQVPLVFPEGIPNLQPRNVRISERAPIVKFDRDKGVAELVERRWSWPSPTGKPVFNMRSDGREFSRDRCLVIADAFFEFTTAADPKQKRKDCWQFRPAGDFAIAGIVREDAKVGQAFTLLTVPPGPDIAGYHNRQIALLEPQDWPAWLDGTGRTADLLQPSAPGSLDVSAAA